MKTFLLRCSVIVLVVVSTTTADFSRLGHKADWPAVNNLDRQFVDQIDWFAQFGERIYLVTKDDRVYAFGNQTSGQNTLGSENNKGRSLTKPTEIVELRNKTIVKFASSIFHVLALSADGTVWAWGYNWQSQLGVGTKVDHTHPVVVHTDIVDIVTVQYSSLALTSSGHVLAWGDNSFGQCGVDNIANTSTPVNVSLDQSVLSLHSTFRGTTVALTGDFQFYVWGPGSGYKSSLLKAELKIISVATTYNKYFVLSETGHIYRSLISKPPSMEAFYTGTFKFKAIYADQSLPDFLVGEAVNGQLWRWLDAEDETRAPVLLTSNDIVQVFSSRGSKGFVPFMVKLDSTTTTTTTTTTSAPPTPTPSPNETCGYSCQVMERMFNNHTTADIQFHIEGKTIYAHRDILRTTSSYMSQQLAGAWKDKSAITIAGYSYRVYYLYLHYLYTDRLNVTADEVLDLYVLAKELNEERLKQRCHYIINHRG